MGCKISVIVPVYDVEEYLPKCLDSILNQTLDFDEIVLVDDGSNDRSGRICDDYSINNPRVIVIHKRNGGLSEARNVGIETSSSDYLLFVDSDDYIDLDTCERFKCLCRRDADLIVGNLRIVTPEEIKRKPHTITNSDVVISGSEYMKMEYNCGTMHMASVQCLYKREYLINNRLYFRKGLLHEDELFTPMVFLNAKSVLPTSIEFYNYILREGSITMKSDKTPNAMSIIEICYLLEEYLKNYTDTSLKNRVLDHCVDIYYKVFIDAELQRHRRIRVSPLYLIKHSKSSKNRLRTLIYLLSPHLLTIIERKRRGI